MAERVVGSILVILFFIASLCAVGYGLTSLRVLNGGVGFIAIGIWLAIVLRVLQAKLHHDELVQRLKPEDG